jgi:hypothetical protein
MIINQKSYRLVPAFIIAAALVIITITASDNARAEEYRLLRSIISAGAPEGCASGYCLKSTLGQPVVGGGRSGAYMLGSGFWQDFGGASAPYDCHPGDANGNTIINILDVAYLINYVYKGGPAPTPYALCSGDPNCNCVTNILDITYLIGYLYKGGPPPCTCQQWLSNCGPPLRK